MKFYQHPNYKELLPQWDVYTDFYQGDKLRLVADDYLVPHEFEKTKGGEKLRAIRQQRTEYTNYIEAFIKRFVSLIFRKPIDMSLALERIDANELANIDGNETTLENFLKREVAARYFLYGKAGIYVDSLDLTVKNKLEEQQLGLRPYLAVVDPRELVDWQVKESVYGKEFQFAVWQYKLLEQRLRADLEPQTNEYVRYLFLDESESYNINIYKKSGEEYTLQSAKTLPLNFIPLTVIESESWVKGAMPKARQLYNLESVLDNIHLFQAHQRIIATGDFQSDDGRLAASEGNLIMLKGQGSVNVVAPADTIAIERRIEQVKMDMLKLVFHQQRHLPATSGSAESWQTMREAKEDFKSIAVNAAQDIQNGINNALFNYLAYTGDAVEPEEYVKLDTNVSEDDVTEFMLWLNSFGDRINKYPTWRKAVDKQAAKRMNLAESEDIVNEIENTVEQVELVKDPIADLLSNNEQ